MPVPRGRTSFRRVEFIFRPTRLGLLLVLYIPPFNFLTELVSPNSQRRKRRFTYRQRPSDDPTPCVLHVFCASRSLSAFRHLSSLTQALTARLSRPSANDEDDTTFTNCLRARARVLCDTGRRAACTRIIDQRSRAAHTSHYGPGWWGCSYRPSYARKTRSQGASTAPVAGCPPSLKCVPTACR